MDYRKAYGLPERYFLSLGRMVEKKNLSTLVEAYARFARSSVEKHAAGSLEQGARTQGAHGLGRGANLTEHRDLSTEHCAPALVFVGSGELEGALREQARGLGLRVVDRTAAGSQSSGASRQEVNAENYKLNTEHSLENHGAAVFFYGFRQIEENAIFYALAEAFVLPSLKEEWGLVVNEAMACSLPVIVSCTAGCAEDLVPGGESWQCPVSVGLKQASLEYSAGSVQSGQNVETENCRLKTGNSLEQRSNGFVFDPSSVEALSEALKRIADQKTKDPRDKETSLLTEMGRRSREIVAKFSCENFARQALSAAKAALP